MKEIPTKAYGNCRYESDRSERDLSTVFIDQDYEFHKNIFRNLDSISVDRGLTSDKDPANKKFFDEAIDETTFLRLQQQKTEKKLKVCVGGDVYKLKNYNKLNIDTTVIKFLNEGRYLLQQWNKEYNDRKYFGEKAEFYKLNKINFTNG